MLIKNLPSGIENHGEERSHKENKLDIKLDSLKWFEAVKKQSIISLAYQSSQRLQWEEYITTKRELNALKKLFILDQIFS